MVHLKTKLKEKLSQIDELNKKRKLDKSDGPLVQLLDKVLNELGVECQAYHGKSFVGNHVNKMLKLENNLQLCNAIPKEVYRMGFVDTDIHTDAIQIATQFKHLFLKYALCHNLMNSCDLFSDEKIDELDAAIKDLMDYLRTTFPNRSITPKLHMLEDHVVDFIKRWHFGLGIYGEQGGESIHPEFNKLRATYASVRPHNARVKVMLEQHHLKVKPMAKSMTPQVKKRKFKDI